MKQENEWWWPDHETHMNDFKRWGPGWNYQSSKYKEAMKYVKDPKNSLAIDVGAHVGTWTYRMAQDFAEVIAFEPCPDHYECWERNIWPHFENVSLITQGLSDIKAPAWMVSEYGNTGCASITHEGAYRVEKVMQSDKFNYGIKTIVFDDWWENKAHNLRSYPIGFIKIDVEGYEGKVIKGMEQMLKNESPVIIVEQKSNKDALRLLTRRGYKEVWEDYGDHILVKE